MQIPLVQLPNLPYIERTWHTRTPPREFPVTHKKPEIAASCVRRLRMAAGCVFVYWLLLDLLRPFPFSGSPCAMSHRSFHYRCFSLKKAPQKAKVALHWRSVSYLRRWGFSYLVSLGAVLHEDRRLIHLDDGITELCCDRDEIKSGPFQLPSAGCLGGPNILKLNTLSASPIWIAYAPIRGKFLGHDSGLAIPTLLYAHARLV